MGLRSSKHSPRSYDITTTVSQKELNTNKTGRTLLNVEVPQVIITPDADKEVNLEWSAPKEQSSKIKSDDTLTSTSAVVENSESPNEVPIDPRIPSWINEENFKPLLAKLHPNFVEVTYFKAYAPLAAGENYATLMLRVKITIKLQDASTLDLSYMLKVAHDNKEMKEMMQFMNFFVIENTVYNEVIPEMEDMYHQAGSSVEFGAKVYRLVPETPTEYYVLLEDLSLRNYKNANRLECLDMEHTQTVLRKLALFHAASACRVATKGSYSETFSRDVESSMARAFVAQMFSSFKKPFMDNLKLYENGEKYETAMNKFFDNAIDAFIWCRKPHPDHFNVINHGDSWCNNILFKYTDDGKVEDCLFVDFQNTNYGSPAQDLLYFIVSSTQVDIKVSKYEYFVRYYHQHLKQNLLLLKYPADKIPRLSELHKQLITYGAWATITSFLTMGMVLLDPTDNAKFENFMGDKKEGMDFKNSVYANPRYIKHINAVLPWLYNRGCMEIGP